MKSLAVWVVLLPLQRLFRHYTPVIAEYSPVHDPLTVWVVLVYQIFPIANRVPIRSFTEVTWLSATHIRDLPEMDSGAYLQTDLVSHTFHCFVENQLNGNLSGSAELVLEVDKINHFVQLLHICTLSD